MLDKVFDASKTYENEGEKANATITGISNLVGQAEQLIEAREVNAVEVEELQASESMKLFGDNWVLTAYLPKGHSTARGIYVTDAAAFEAQMGIALTGIEGVVPA